MLICHVCGKEKKPYLVIMNSNILSFMKYEQAREKGEICERCDHYFAMTGEFKDATEQEMKLAEESMKFAFAMQEWWEKDKPLTEEDSTREWGGIEFISKWFREKYASHDLNEEVKNG